MKASRRVIGAVLAAALALPGAMNAKPLVIGLASAPASMDPHARNDGSSNAIANHIFSTLVEQDEKQRIVPGVAASWRMRDARTWEFRLRREARFHDGTPLTAADVVFSWQRAAEVNVSPSGFAPYVAGKTVTKVDDYTVRISTSAPHPLMLQDASSVHIVSRKHGAGAATGDYDSGRAAIGSGPYKLRRYLQGDRIELVRNESYFGNKPLWTTVTFELIDSASARVAALLAGRVDLIDQVPTPDIARLARSPNTTLSQGVSNRLIYLHMDQFRADSPFVRANDGSLIQNPLLDVRVRKAISNAIDRNAIVTRVMNGAAVKAGQLLPQGFFGRSNALQAHAYDPQAATQLLAAAGLTEGFRLSLHGPSGRYMHDAEIVQQIGRMLTRVGIETEVVTMPPGIYFKRASRGGRGGAPEFSLMLVGWAAGSGETSSPLKSILHSYDKQRGIGTSNRGRHSDPEVDRLIQQALTSVDDSERAALLAEATEIAIGRNQGIIPLHYQVNTWAAKKGLKYTARSDARTRAMEAVEQ